MGNKQDVLVAAGAVALERAPVDNAPHEAAKPRLYLNIGLAALYALVMVTRVSPAIGYPKIFAPSEIVGSSLKDADVILAQILDNDYGLDGKPTRDDIGRLPRAKKRTSVHARERNADKRRSERLGLTHAGCR